MGCAILPSAANLTCAQIAAPVASKIEQSSQSDGIGVTTRYTPIQTTDEATRSSFALPNGGRRPSIWSSQQDALASGYTMRSVYKLAPMDLKGRHHHTRELCQEYTFVNPCTGERQATATPHSLSLMDKFNPTLETLA